jgi:hypothetical protein
MILDISDSDGDQLLAWLNGERAKMRVIAKIRARQHGIRASAGSGYAAIEADWMDRIATQIALRRERPTSTLYDHGASR